MQLSQALCVYVFPTDCTTMYLSVITMYRFTVFLSVFLYVCCLVVQQFRSLVHVCLFSSLRYLSGLCCLALAHLCECMHI